MTELTEARPTPEAAICAVVWDKLREQYDLPAHSFDTMSDLVEHYADYYAAHFGLAVELEAIEAVRRSGIPTPHIPLKDESWARDTWFECESRCLGTPYGGVAYPYWSGGGKHNDPTELDWFDEARYVNHRIEIRPVDVFDEPGSEQK